MLEEIKSQASQVQKELKDTAFLPDLIARKERTELDLDLLHQKYCPGMCCMFYWRISALKTSRKVMVPPRKTIRVHTRHKVILCQLLPRAMLTDFSVKPFGPFNIKLKPCQAIFSLVVNVSSVLE